jgi:hypothetical protein
MTDGAGPVREARGLRELLDAIERLPSDWHGAGTLGAPALRAIADHAKPLELRHSLETGVGRSTLLLSHCSPDHRVFALDHGDSLRRTRESRLLRSDTVTFIEGPTQQTLAVTALPAALQFALLDGPHGYPFPELEYYHVYPKLAAGAVLVVDDIHIPTVRHLWQVLCEDEMFERLEVVQTTGFLRRTSAPTFDPLADGWWLQKWNAARHPVGGGLRGWLRKWLGRS